jgi:transcription antitermination factor NusG
MPCGSHRWFCAHTHPAGEFRAELDLLGKGFCVFLPLHLDRRTERIEPLFSRYLFVQFDPGRDQWRRIYRCRGIETLITTTTDRPLPVPHGIVEALIARTSDRRIVDDPRDEPLPPPGAAVRVLQGPLAGWAGVVRLSRPNRLRLLLEALAGHVEVELRPEMVAVVA